MAKIADQTYLQNKQYQNDSNLNARRQLHARFSTNHYGWDRWIFDRLKLPTQARILELGCGPAQLWVKNIDRIPKGWNITLSDFSPGMVESAQQNLNDHPHQFTFDVIDAQSIPYDDQHFDVVIANHMLYHVPDKAKAFSEIHRVLKPGGQFYATTVGDAHMQELDNLVLSFDPKIELIFARSDVQSFILENGAAQLEQWFTNVTAYHYDNALVITEVKPLVDYVLSTITFTEDKLADFTKYVERKLTRDGSIHVTKASGLFEAIREGDH
jgi:ubiquinone/menaquinone biosynthesis C-methylase UbiE